MLTLSFYSTATNIKELLKTGDQFVEIIAGIRTSSIARVIDVVYVNYSTHRYLLEIKKRRPFMIHGKNLVHLPNYKGETKLNVVTKPPDQFDLFGRKIEVGSVVIWSKCLKHYNYKSTPVMIVGTVKNISLTGTIFVKPIKIGCEDAGENKLLNDKLLRLFDSTKALVIDGNTTTQIMMHKLCSY